MSQPTDDNKSVAVRNMFGMIAAHYDLMNLLMTGSRDESWRKMAVSEARLPEKGRFVDAGFSNVRYRRLMFDAMVIHGGYKPFPASPGAASA